MKRLSLAWVVLAAVFATNLTLARADDPNPAANGRQRVNTTVGGGSAADVLNMRAAPSSEEGGAQPAPSLKIEITCVDDSGRRFDSHDSGYRDCLAKKGKK